MKYMEGLIIREANLSDESEILSIRNHPDIFKWFFDNSTIDAAKHKEWFTSRLLYFKFLTLVAELNGEVIGTAVLNHPEFISPSISISVKPGLTQSGVGSKLLLELVVRSRLNNIRSLTAEVLKSNSASYQFFTKNGFKVNKIEPRMIGTKKSEIFIMKLTLIY